MATSLPLASLGGQLSARRSQRIRVLIADETPMSCQLLKSALARSRFRFEIVACVINRADFIDFLKEHPVDVTLVSESLQDGTHSGSLQMYPGCTRRTDLGQQRPTAFRPGGLDRCYPSACN